LILLLDLKTTAKEIYNMAVNLEFSGKKETGNRSKKILMLTVFLLFNLPGLEADIVVFQSGKKLEDVKIKVGRDTADIFFGNGKREIRKKSELKSIKLRPISWDFGNTNQEANKEKPLTPKKSYSQIKKLFEKRLEQKKQQELQKEFENEIEKAIEKRDAANKQKDDVKQKEDSPEEIEIKKQKEVKKQKEILESEFKKLEEKREANFSIPLRINEERKRHDFLTKERIRIQYTEGYLTYSSGQTIYTEVMLKNENRYYVRNEYGLLYFNFQDFGDELTIETDSGKENIPISRMLPLKEEKYLKGFIYLSSGERYKGNIGKSIGDDVLLQTTKGTITVSSGEILFPKITSKDIKGKKISIKEGDKGKFVFIGGQTINGKLIKWSEKFIIVESNQGLLEMNTANLVSATKEDSE